MMPLPERDGPARLWSLLDMIERLGVLLNFRGEVHDQRKRWAKEPAEASIEPSPAQGLRMALGQWRTMLDNHDFQHASYAVMTLEQRHRKATCGDVVRQLDEIVSAFEHDASQRLVEVIPAGRKDFYNAGFGHDVNHAFPSAVPEIKEANTCYAVGRYTASVFHLMRASEHGLRVLAGAVGVVGNPVPLEFQQWQNYVDQIESRWKNSGSNQWRDPARGNARAFFSGVLADASFFKDAIRNVTMHTRTGGTYDAPGALSVRNRVREWFLRLSKYVNEDRNEPLLNEKRFT